MGVYPIVQEIPCTCDGIIEWPGEGVSGSDMNGTEFGRHIPADDRVPVKFYSTIVILENPVIRPVSQDDQSIVEFSCEVFIGAD